MIDFSDYRLLLAAKDSDDARRIRDLLHDGAGPPGQIVEVGTIADALDTLARMRIDAVLLDLRLPDCRGAECVARMRATSGGNTAIVALTGPESEDVALECLAAGAQDYLGKNDMRPISLRRAIGYAIARVRESAAQTNAANLRTRIAGIVEGSTDAIISCDGHARVTSWNRGAEMIFGYPREEAIGRHVGEVIRLVEGEPDDQQFLIDKAMRGEFGTPREVTRLRRDGTIALFSAVAFPLPSMHGEEPGFGAICRDITEARAREAELQRAQRLEALGTLAGGLAHDLNNTMLPIVTLGSLLLEDFQGTDDQRESLKLVVDAAERAKTMVRDLLNFSRKGQSAFHPVRLDRLVESTLRVIRAGLPATVRFRTSLAPVPEIIGNPSRLYQLLLNLVTNAGQAIGARGGTITITVCGDAAGMVRLTVADDGSGMDADTQARLFEPFFTTKADDAGTGLGLTVVRAVVADHDGTIAVSSSLDRGTSFDLRFPVAQSA